MLEWGEFNKMTTEEWKSKVDLDLKGKKLASDFAYNVEGDFKVDPFITQNQNINSLSLPPIFTKSCIWIKVSDAKSGNQKALNFLSLGTESLVIEMDNDLDFEVLFEGIYLDMITVFLIVKENGDALKSKLSAYIATYYPLENVNILLLFINKNKLGFEDSFKGRLVRFNSLVDDTPQGNQLLVLVELKKDFLAQIAELRALRTIWMKKKAKAENLILIACFNEKSILDDEIHPLIISNYLLMSACFGLSNFASGIPEDFDSELARLCLNIQHIFKEESNLQMVADPVSGSYLIETLTSEMVMSVL
jgi:hypothetical protein